MNIQLGLERPAVQTAAPIETLAGAYSGLVAWIVGSGPSLAWLGREDIGPGPVIAINFAIQKLEELRMPPPVYSMQKDAWFCETEYPVLSHSHESGKEGWGAYVFDNVAFGLAWNKPSLLSALSIAKLWGCARVIGLCFDSITRGDLNSYEDGKVITKSCRGQYPIIGAWAKEWARVIGMPVEWRMVWPKSS